MVHLELYFSYMVVLKALISNTDPTVFMIHVVLHVSYIHAKENTTDTLLTGQLQVLEIKYKIGFIITTITRQHYHKAY